MNCSFQIRILTVGALFILLLGSNPFLQAANVEEGITLYREGKYTAAIAHFENLLSGLTSRSERRPLYRFLGKSYESIGRNDKAVSAYEEAVQYDTRNWRRHRDLGGLYELSSLNQEALACYKKAYKLNPKEAMLLLDLGRLNRKLGLYSDALPLLEKAAKLGGSDTEVQKELSHVFEGQGHFAEAALAASKSDQQGLRLTYLAALSHQPILVKEGMARLEAAKVSQETRQMYENLVQLLQLPPKEILAGKTSNSALQAILKTPFTEGSK